MRKHTTLPLTNTHWGTYRVETKNGEVKALHGFELDDDVSAIGSGIIDVLDGPSRIQRPAIRKSWIENGPGNNNPGRGQESFVEVSWQTAEKLVSEELDRVRNKFGNQAIYAGSYGWASAGRFHHAQSQIHRFLNCIGGYTRSKETYSFAAAEVVVPHVLGDFRHYLPYSTSWLSIAQSTELLVAFGGIPLKNGQINSGGIGRHTQRENLKKAKQAGVEFVNISPIRADIDSFADAHWLAPRPGTDTAIMLGLAHTLYVAQLHDKEFLEKYTTGFDKFLPYLIGEQDGITKDATWAANISGLDSTEIETLARRMAKQRTMISISWSLTRQDHGEQPYWAAITLAAMLGQIGLPGGGIGFGYSATNSIGDHYSKLSGASLPQGKNSVDEFIPVARISDMLLNPGKAYHYNGENKVYPNINLVYWAGGNPFHHHQDLNRMLQAWRKPDTIIVHDWCWNSMAKHADIVLPCTTTLERNDISFSPRDPYVVSMSKVIDPPADARNDFDILSALSRHLGVYEEFTEGRNEAEWLDWLYQSTRQMNNENKNLLPTYEELKEQGWFAPNPPQEPEVFLKSFRQDPLKNPLRTESGLIEIFSRKIDSFNYKDCPGHPYWMEPLEWLGQEKNDYPLHLISNQPASKLHSQLDHGSYSRAAKIKQREPVIVNSKDALDRGLSGGDIVRVFNRRGACLGGVVIADNIMPGVVQMSTGAWYDPLEPGVIGSLCKHGNPNVLTPDKGTSKLAQGPIAHTCMVEIEKYQQDAPSVTAFDPPQFLPEKE